MDKFFQYFLHKRWLFFMMEDFYKVSIYSNSYESRTDDIMIVGER